MSADKKRSFLSRVSEQAIVAAAGGGARRGVPWRGVSGHGTAVVYMGIAGWPAGDAARGAPTGQTTRIPAGRLRQHDETT